MTGKRKKLYLGFVVYFTAVLTITVAPPFVSMWNRIEPQFLSLPFAQWAVIVLAVFLVVGLASWFIIEGRLNTQEKSLRIRISQNDD